MWGAEESIWHGLAGLLLGGGTVAICVKSWFTWKTKREDRELEREKLERQVDQENFRYYVDGIKENLERVKRDLTKERGYTSYLRNQAQKSEEDRISGHNELVAMEKEIREDAARIDQLERDHADCQANIKRLEGEIAKLKGASYA